jgi:maltose alpha-D-glucosyltransferase/alpha-amylase
VSRSRNRGPVVTAADDPLWYKDAVIYEVHVRAFADSNGDGIGDFRGLMGRLDYLQDLGVTALWLLPFYPSPLRDDGYDIADYTAIHPSYGTLADFKAFLREAHRRGLRVITELVVNHTSDQHPWFQRARRSPPGSRWRDFYVWSDTADKYQEARIIFKDFEPSNWTWDPVAHAYYWHRFYCHQPDLNYDNPEVHEAIFKVLDFWLSMGIDGLRLDAVPYLCEREGTNCENLPETHAFLKELRAHVDEKFQGRMLLAEANQWPEDAVAYFGSGDECHMAFHFPVMPRLFMSIRMEDRFPVLDILQQTPPIPPTCQWAMFLRNHDELTLEMVTDEDRDYMYKVYAQDPQARINLGIRRRLAPLLENHRGKIELMNGLLFSLPGTPVLYYGDEIGMGDNIYLGDRNGVRTPMQWSGGRNAGFSQANPQRLYFPVIIDPEYHFEVVNVEAQQNNPHSLLWWMKHLIALRKRHRAFSRGTLDFLTPDNAKVLSFLRRYSPAESNGATGHDEIVLVVANLSRFVQAVSLDLSAFAGMVPVEMLGRSALPAVGQSSYFLTLGPYAFYWFILEPQHLRAARPETQDEPLVLEVNERWEEVFYGPARQTLEEALPEYLQRCPWFQGKERQTEAALILETVPLAFPLTPAHVALIRVEYTEGDPETYLLPLAFAAGLHAEEVRKRLPQAVVGRVHESSGIEGFLYDPLGDEPFARALVEAIARRRRFRRSGGELLALPLGQVPPAEGLPPAALLSCEHNNTCVGYGDRLVLKVFRRLEEGINPELELGHFLATKTTFRQVAPLVGALEYRRSPGESMTLAVLQEFVPNQGDGWHYTLDALGRYYQEALARSEAERDLPCPRRPLLELATEPLPQAAHERMGSFLEMVRLLGQRTAEFHCALASGVDDPAFTPEPFTTLYQRSLYQSMRSQTRRAFEQLRKQVHQLPEPVREHARKLLGHEEELLKRTQAVFAHKIPAQRTRCHGDYHLTQILCTGKDVVLFDLEGESGRSLSERRRKLSPLRDVASMLRSFHYAALVALRDGGLRVEDAPALAPWARFWHLWVSVAFMKAYLATAGGAAFLPAPEKGLGALLDFYLLKRAVNELRYELNRGSDRVYVPVLGLLQLLQGSEGP